MKKSNEKVYGNDGNADVLSLVPPEAQYILDIGCGNGAIAKKLYATGCVVDGITISEQEKDQARHFMRQVFVQNVEIGLPMEGLDLYDTVICSHVLEHICYPQKLLQDIKRVLKKNGSLIVALPNLMHYKSRIQLMKGNFNYAETGIWDYTHFRWYTFQTARQLLEQNHFSIELATVTGDLPFNSLFKKILPHRISKAIFGLLIKISKGFFGYQLLFVAKKIEIL
jgi:2-polyprenyl-3-methyl-5-hydroxy-6-metoxy-1,4-benzoquinol methylase